MKHLALPFETWYPVNIPDFQEYYEVSDFGQVRNSKTKKILSIRKDKKGYSRACLMRNGKRWDGHRAILIARTFPEICGEWFDGCEVDHINGYRTDDRPCNLRVVTHKENIRNPITLHRFKFRDLPQCRKSVIERPVKPKQLIAQIKNGELVGVYASISEAAKNVGCSATNVGYAINHTVIKGYAQQTAGGYTWEYISDEFTLEDFWFITQQTGT